MEQTFGIEIAILDGFGNSKLPISADEKIIHSLDARLKLGYKIQNVPSCSAVYRIQANHSARDASRAAKLIADPNWLLLKQGASCDTAVRGGQYGDQ